MFDESDDDDLIEFVVLLNSVPIHFHKSVNVKTTLRKYYNIANNIDKTTPEDEAILDKKVNKLIHNGKARIKRFLFLKFNNINIDDLSKRV